MHLRPASAATALEFLIVLLLWLPSSAARVPHWPGTDNDGRSQSSLSVLTAQPCSDKAQVGSRTKKIS